MAKYDIPLYKPYIGNKEKELVNQALNEGWVSSRGKFVEIFEHKFAEYVGRKHALTVCNGTASLHLALEALKFPKDSAVICPSLTYVSSANAIRYAGLYPIFIDCNENGISDIDDFKRGIEFAKSRGRVISALMPVHLYGMMANVDELIKLGYPIIEDCAESIGSKLFDKLSGSHKTEFASFSFFGNKTITTGEGGMLVCDDDDLHSKALVLRSVGQMPGTPQRYLHVDVGYNYRLTNIASAIGIGQLENISDILYKKQNIAKIYKSCLGNFGFDNLILKEPDGCVGNNWLVTLVLDSNAMREGLILYLESKKVETRPAFLPMHCMVNLGDFDAEKSMINSERIGSCGINLPSYPELTEKQVMDVCSHVINFCNMFKR